MCDKRPVRMVVARVLVVLAVILAVLSLLAAFIRFQALDTDTASDTASAMIADDEIREQVALSLVEQLYANVDVSEALEQRLPADQQGLAGPIAGAVRELSDRAAVRMLERPRVQELWVGAFTRAHAQLIEVLENETELARVEGGAIVLDLQPLVIELGDRVAIIGQVANRLGPDAGVIEVMDAGELETAQDLTQFLKVLGNWLWIVPVLLFGIALWIVPGRRQSILRMIAVGSIIGGLLVLVLRRVAGSYVVDELVASHSVRPAVGDGDPDRPAPGRRVDPARARRPGASGLLAGRNVLEVRRRAARARPVPRPRRCRLRNRGRSLPSPALVAADRADLARPADARRGRHTRARGRAAPSTDGP